MDENYLPKGATAVEIVSDDGDPSDPLLVVELMDGFDQFQSISLSNISERDDFIHDNSFKTSQPSLNHFYKTEADAKDWISFRALASKARDYTLLSTLPDYRFTAVGSEHIKTRGSSEIVKKLRFQVFGQGRVKIKIPYYMVTIERGVLEDENWKGSGRYINTLYGKLKQDYAEYSKDITKGYSDQHTLHQRSFDNELGRYIVNISSNFSTDNGISPPIVSDKNTLRAINKDVFILEGQVEDGIIEVELRMRSTAILDYYITE
jgi:hypothetical protein